MGLTPHGEALRRSGAKPGDALYVSGPLGSAGLGLKMCLNTTSSTDPSAIHALELPEPRIELGMTLRGLASACIDISDGLAQDLGHILTASHVGATIEYDRLPLTASVRQHIADSDDWPLPLTAGDDYELCFTVTPDKVGQLETRLAEKRLTATCIGRIESDAGLRIHRNDHTHTFKATGYDHFAQR